MCFQISIIMTFWIWNAKFSTAGDGNEVVKIIFHCRTKVQRDLATHEKRKRANLPKSDVREVEMSSI